MNLKGCERKRSWLILREYPNNCLQRLRRIMKLLNQYSQPPVQEVNPMTSEYEAGVPTFARVRYINIWVRDQLWQSSYYYATTK
jgi:hypothetical protein